MMYSNLNKLTVRIFGGIGNQLFCYAAARRLSIVNNCELIVDHVTGFEGDPYNRVYQLDHFNINCKKATALQRLEPFSKLQRHVRRKVNLGKVDYVFQEGSSFSDRLIDFKIKRNTYIEGYWQSEKYFIDTMDTIRKDLLIKPPTNKENIAMASEILKRNSVAIHFRFFDNPSSEINVNNLTMEYYNKAISAIELKKSNLHYYIFSDQPNEVSKYIDLNRSQFTIVAHNIGDSNAYADLWLMSLCSNFIIANSTFSWWGAWLSNNPNKLVYAPNIKKSGITSWGFIGLIPDNWILI
jgi:hypothetical protein